MKNSNKPWAPLFQPFKFPGLLPKFYRFTGLCIVLLSLLGYAVQTEGRLPFQFSSDRLSSALPNMTAPAEIKPEELQERLNSERAANGLEPLESDTSLQKAARFLSLEMEDSQALEIPDDVKPYLASVSTSLPNQIETFAVFFSGLAGIEQFEPVASSSATQDPSFTRVGIAVREAEFQNTEGQLVVVMVSPDFSNTYEQSGQAALPPTVSEQPPSYTGEDLWQAVQNYRRAQNLPEFTQSNELCTVASIRVNELLELGKLDNHDGFDARSEQFFERNPTWTSINENLASGYQTAVQVVEWGWDQSLGHKALIQSREFPSACTAANRGFAVLITGK